MTEFRSNKRLKNPSELFSFEDKQTNNFRNVSKDANVSEHSNVSTLFYAQKYLFLILIEKY